MLIPILIGTLAVTACGNRNYDYMNQDDTDEIVSEKTYELSIHYSNTDIIENDIIAIFDEDAEIYGGLNVTPGEEDRVMQIATSNYIISSELLGELTVNLEENEMAHLYIDYSEKTMNIEIEKIETK